MNIPLMIKTCRLLLGIDQKEFGLRFGLSGVAVSLWESGKREAPYKVIEYVLAHSDPPIKEYVICQRCGGKGIVSSQADETHE